MTRDPYRGNSGGAGDVGNPQSWNRYAYVLGDPVNYYDPNGLFAEAPAQPPDPSIFSVSDPGPTQGSDKGDKPSHAETFQDEWDSLSKDCQNGLNTAVKGSLALKLGALNRAWSVQGMLQTATAGTSVDWTMLAAIGIRESGFQNINQTNGQGVGFFQIDLGQNPSVTAANASNLVWSANWAVQYLAARIPAVANALQGLNGAAIAGWSGVGSIFDISVADTYNLGLGRVKSFLSHQLDPDLGTTGENYGQNIWQLMQCFH